MKKYFFKEVFLNIIALTIPFSAIIIIYIIFDLQTTKPFSTHSIISRHWHIASN
jgi:hypothetical protein